MSKFEDDMNRIEKALLSNVIPFTLGFLFALIIVCISFD